jgi:hypothetical protein
VGLVVAAGRALAAVVLLLAADTLAAALAFLLFGLIGNEKSAGQSGNSISATLAKNAHLFLAGRVRVIAVVHVHWRLEVVGA